MTDRTYITTTEIENARSLWEQGVLVAQRTGDFYKTQLYQINDFYVEVAWHTHFNVVVKVTRFDDTGKLEPYLNDISIAGLFS